MHTERPWAVVTGLIVDADAAVVVRCIGVCPAWRSYILGAPLRAADRALSGRIWTTGEPYAEWSCCRRALIGDSPVVIHIENSRGTILGTLAVVIGQGDGIRTGCPDDRLLFATRQNDQQSQHYRKSKTNLTRSHGRFLSSACATLPRWDLLSSKTRASILPPAQEPLLGQQTLTPKRQRNSLLQECKLSFNWPTNVHCHSALP